MSTQNPAYLWFRYRGSSSEFITLQFKINGGEWQTFGGEGGGLGGVQTYAVLFDFDWYGIQVGDLVEIGITKWSDGSDVESVYDWAINRWTLKRKPVQFGAGYTESSIDGNWTSNFGLEQPFSFVHDGTNVYININIGNGSLITVQPNPVDSFIEPSNQTTMYVPNDETNQRNQQIEYGGYKTGFYDDSYGEPQTIEMPVEPECTMYQNQSSTIWEGDMQFCDGTWQYYGEGYVSQIPAGGKICLRTGSFRTAVGFDLVPLYACDGSEQPYYPPNEVELPYFPQQPSYGQATEMPTGFYDDQPPATPQQASNFFFPNFKALQPAACMVYQNQTEYDWLGDYQMCDGTWQYAGTIGAGASVCLVSGTAFTLNGMDLVELYSCDSEPPINRNPTIPEIPQPMPYVPQPQPYYPPNEVELPYFPQQPSYGQAAEMPTGFYDDQVQQPYFPQPIDMPYEPQPQPYFPQPIEQPYTPQPVENTYPQPPYEEPKSIEKPYLPDYPIMSLPINEIINPIESVIVPETYQPSIPSYGEPQIVEMPVEQPVISTPVNPIDEFIGGGISVPPLIATPPTASSPTPTVASPTPVTTSPVTQKPEVKGEKKNLTPYVYGGFGILVILVVARMLTKKN